VEKDENNGLKTHLTPSLQNSELKDNCCFI